MPHDVSRRSLMGLGAAGLAAAGAPALAAPDPDAGPIRLKPGLRSKLAARLAAAQIPALAVAAVKDGVPVAIDALGQASVPFGVPASERTLFHLGSTSKQFTAALILRLADSGRVGLDDPIGRHVHDLPPKLAGLPIRALLSHTSGAPEYDDLPGLEGDHAVTRAAFLARIAELPIDFAPGEAWSYSNTGYVLLGYLVADIVGRPYREILTEDLLKPARFRDARVDDAPALIAGRAEPYELQDGVVRHAMMMDGDFSGWPDGAMLMSARDAARWERGLQAGSVIPGASFARMTTPVTLSTGRSCGYGFGWRIDQVRGQPIHYHTGSVPGFLSFYLRVPARGVGVVVMTNLGALAGRRMVGQVAQEVAEQIAPGSSLLSLSPIRDDDPALTADVRKMLTRGDAPLDAGRFAPEIANLLGRPSGRQVTPPNWGEKGPRGFELAEAFAEGQGMVRRYRATFADRVEHIAFAHAADGRIFRIRSI